MKPVTITLPVSLGNTHHDIPDPTACWVRILFLSSDGEKKEWKEITDDLKKPVTFDGMTVKFQVERFSGYVCFLIVHFTVVCLVAKPLNRNEAKGDLVLIQTLLLFKCKLLFYHAN